MRAKLGELPYQVYVILEIPCAIKDKRNVSNSSEMQLHGFSCGGTLIEDKNKNQWIVTAAHCINPGSANLPKHPKTSLAVQAGYVSKFDTENMQQKQVLLDKSHVIFHPEWKGSTKESSCTDICDFYVKIECANAPCDQCGNPNYTGTHFI